MTLPRIVIPDPPSYSNPEFSGSTSKFLGAMVTWAQKTKGNLYAQSAQFQGAYTVKVSNPSSGVTLNVKSDLRSSWGNGTFSTDTSGNFNILHGLSTLPSYAAAQTLNAGTQAYLVNVISLTTSSLACKLVTGTGAVASTSIGVLFAAAV